MGLRKGQTNSGSFKKGCVPHNKGKAKPKKAYCIDCLKNGINTELSRLDAKRCLSHAIKFRWDNEEYKRKVSQSISKGRKGIKFTVEHIKNLSKSLEGHKAWNKDLKIRLNTGRTHFKKGCKINIGRKRFDMRGDKNYNYGKPFKPFWGEYNGIKMRSGWEIGYAKYLDKNNIEWIYEPKHFKLDKTTYTPDFYLPESNVYIEIKGYMTEKALNKLKEFVKTFPNIKLQILQQKQLRKVGAIK